jgi:hypothetical protein
MGQSLSDAAKAKIAEQVGVVGIRPPWLPVLWTIGVLVFCLTCPAGIWMGVRQRIPEYPPLDTLIGADVKPTEQERAKLYEAYWLLRAQNVPPHEVREVFDTVFKVILDPAKTYQPDGFREKTPADARYSKVEQAVRAMKFDAKLRRPTLAE